MASRMKNVLRKLLLSRASDQASRACQSTGDRPDLLDLIGPEYDCTPQAPAGRTLIICAAQRTGSYELSRFLTAGGIGTPHEYFNPQFAVILAARWNLAEDPLTSANIGDYIKALRRRRSRNGLFATKLQYWQFERALRNLHGERLFEDAVVIHLFRSNITGQLRSYRKALVTGIWDYTERTTSVPAYDGEAEAYAALDQLVAEDSGFRRMFALLEIDPVFITTEDLSRKPREVIKRIAERLSFSVDEAALSTAIASSAPYKGGLEPHDYAQAFRSRVFNASE